MKTRNPLTVKEILAKNCHSSTIKSKKIQEENGAQQETVPWGGKLQPGLSVPKRNCEGIRSEPSQDQATNGLVDVGIRAKKLGDNLGGKGSGSGQICPEKIQA